MIDLQYYLIHGAIIVLRQRNYAEFVKEIICMGPKRLFAKSNLTLPIWNSRNMPKMLVVLFAILFSLTAQAQTADLTLSNRPSASFYTKTGDIINYSILVNNTGNVTLFDLKISDPNAELKAGSYIASLLPGDEVSIAASHTISQADLDAGRLENIAKVSGFDQEGKPIEKAGRKVIILGLQHPELTTAATASAMAFKQEGDVIEYTLVVKNTGNITMNNIEVFDSNSSLIFDGSIKSLAPGETDSIKAEYRISMSDINSGKIVKTGIAQALGANNQLYVYNSNEVEIRLAIENFNLSNYPNPVDTETTIVFDLPEQSAVILKVYDLTGREVGQIDRMECNPGRNYINWKPADTPNGLYTLKLYCNGAQASRRIMVAR